MDRNRAIGAAIAFWIRVRNRFHVLFQGTDVRVEMCVRLVRVRLNGWHSIESRFDSDVHHDTDE